MCLYVFVFFQISPLVYFLHLYLYLLLWSVSISFGGCLRGIVTNIRTTSCPSSDKKFLIVHWTREYFLLFSTFWCFYLSKDFSLAFYLIFFAWNFFISLIIHVCVKQCVCVCVFVPVSLRIGKTIWKVGNA